ncbi:MAG: response regulator [Defluviitaleaceae bacterium]|nr:response regulator [Defluviitaleaceae bacterium]MCL2262552.1 response regulator [Defluviitaleaceae bacterium]
MRKYDGERYYHSIPGLLVPRSTVSDEVHEAINKFIDVIPDLSAKLDDCIMNVEVSEMRDAFMKAMHSLINMLKSIYARGLETEANRLLNCTKDEKMFSLAKKNFKPFITETLSLSVAMQKAQKGGESEEKSVKVSKIEVYANTAKSLNAVSSLLEDGFVDPARVLLSELSTHHPETVVFANLLALIDNGKTDEAKVMIDTLRQKFNETLNKMAGTDLNKKILAVDDMPEILSFVNNALKSHYKVIAVPGGQAALKVMETQKPDLFILDIDMPGMDGFELAVRIRQMQEHATTPIIFLTGNSSREHIANATQVGGNEFIVKPASHEYLLTKVGSFLNE